MANNYNYKPALTITDTTASTSTTTGALVVAGGIGVVGDANVSSAITNTNVINSSLSNSYFYVAPDFFEDSTVAVLNNAGNEMKTVCLTNDGTIVWAGDNEYICMYNPDTSLLTAFTKAGIGGSGTSVTGSVYDPHNNNIYFCEGRRVTRWNPITDAFTDFGDIAGVNRSIIGMTWNPHDNTLYMNIDADVGSSSNNVIIGTYDITGNTFDVATYTGTASTATVDRHWFRAPCLAPNGKLYSAPSSQTVVAIVDPVNSTLDTTSVTGIAGSIKYGPFTLATDGFLYALPQNASTVLRLDPRNDGITTIVTGIPILSVDTVKGYSDSRLGLDGNIHGFTRDAIKGTLLLNESPPLFTHFLDPTFGTWFSNGATLCQHPNGRMYTIGSTINTVAKIGLKGTISTPIHTCCNPVVNRG